MYKGYEEKKKTFLHHAIIHLCQLVYLYVCSQETY